jgi:hypothetical protein
VRVLPHGRRQDHLHLERFTKKENGENGEPPLLRDGKMWEMVGL